MTPGFQLAGSGPSVSCQGLQVLESIKYGSTSVRDRDSFNWPMLIFLEETVATKASTSGVKRLGKHSGTVVSYFSWMKAGCHPSPPPPGSHVNLQGWGTPSSCLFWGFLCLLLILVEGGWEATPPIPPPIGKLKPEANYTHSPASSSAPGPARRGYGRIKPPAD